MKLVSKKHMEIFCDHVNAKSSRPFSVIGQDYLSPETVTRWEGLREEYDDFPGAQLKQGIREIHFLSEGVYFTETPYLHPTAKTPGDQPNLKGPMTGVLVNCVDRSNRVALLQIRGKGIEKEYRAQNAAAGYGQFRVPLTRTVLSEIADEAGIHNPQFLFNGKAIDLLPHMAEGYPQPLASYTLEGNLSGFDLCRDMGEVLAFRDQKMQEVIDGKPPEAFPFAVPYDRLEQIAGELHEQGRFHGPVHRSITNSVRALRDFEGYS